VRRTTAVLSLTMEFFIFFPFRAFEHTAQTIIHVGQQGIVASLLRSEANALLIDSCNEALTELISLFNVRTVSRLNKKLFFFLWGCNSNLRFFFFPGPVQLEEIVDVRRWQTDLEVARVRDHKELLSMGRRIESGNAAIHCELAQQGATITEVLRVVHVRKLNAPSRPRLPASLALLLRSRRSQPTTP